MSIEGISDDSSHKHTHKHKQQPCLTSTSVTALACTSPSLKLNDQNNNNTEQPNITSNARPSGQRSRARVASGWAERRPRRRHGNKQISCATGALSTHSAAQPLCSTNAQLISEVIAFVRSDAALPELEIKGYF